MFQQEDGFTLIEIIGAILVLSIIGLVVGEIYAGGLRGIFFAEQRTSILFEGQSKMNNYIKELNFHFEENLETGNVNTPYSNNSNHDPQPGINIPISIDFSDFDTDDYIIDDGLIPDPTSGDPILIETVTYEVDIDFDNSGFSPPIDTERYGTLYTLEASVEDDVSFDQEVNLFYGSPICHTRAYQAYQVSGSQP